MYLPDRLSPTPAPTPVTDELALGEIVRFVDRAVDDQTGHLLLRLAGCPPKLGLLCLGDAHPFDSLVGFTAPLSWQALGVRCPARAYRVDGPGDLGPGRPAEATTREHEGMFVMMLDRSGRGVGILREGDAVTTLDEAPEGLLADACRRALGLPTAPAPDSTVELWVRIWLDRVVDAAAHRDGRGLDSWSAVAALHPGWPMGGVPGLGSESLPADPVEVVDPCVLAEATQTLAAAWPWSQLRRDPEVLDTGRPPVGGDLAAWMDDGLFARWVLAEIADLDYAATALAALLPPEVTGRVVDAVRATGLSWPASS